MASAVGDANTDKTRVPTDWEWSSARFWEAWPNVPIRMDAPFT
jgi:hypothetical protein